MKLRRGHLYVVDFNPRVRTKPGKVRPALVVQDDLVNEAGYPSTIVLPTTTKLADTDTPLRLRITSGIAGARPRQRCPGRSGDRGGQRVVPQGAWCASCRAARDARPEAPHGDGPLSTGPSLRSSRALAAPQPGIGPRSAVTAASSGDSGTRVTVQQGHDRRALGRRLRPGTTNVPDCHVVERGLRYRRDVRSDQGAARRLRGASHHSGVYDVERFSEVSGADATIVELARQQGWAVLTQDLDFSAIVAISGRTEPSVISMRLRSSRVEEFNARVEAVLPLIAKDVAAGTIVTVEDGRVRVRLLPVG